MTNRTKGILFILGEGFSFAVMNLFIRLAGDVPLMEKIFFRNFFAAFVSLFFLWKEGQKIVFPKAQLPNLLGRSIAGLIGVLGNFYAVSHMHMTDATMLNKLSPFFAILFSAWLIKEKPNRVQILCVITAFLGALLIIKPFGVTVSFASLAGFISGIGAGLAYVFVRMLGKQGADRFIVVLFFSLFTMICSLPFLLASWEPVTLKELLCLVGVGIGGAGGQICVTSAYFYAPAREISVYDYAQLIFAGILALVFLGEIPDWLSLLGYGVILVAAIFLWQQGRKEEKTVTLKEKRNIFSI